MEYKGKLYGKLGNKYFDTGKTSTDWDNMENEIKYLKEKLSNSINWIKFSEKEPQKGQIVDIFSLARGRESDFKYEGNGIFYNNDDDETREVLFSKTDTKYNVTHWIFILDCL